MFLRNTIRIEIWGAVVLKSLKNFYLFNKSSRRLIFPFELKNFKTVICKMSHMYRKLYCSAFCNTCIGLADKFR
jgi:hypothetical protein